MSFTVYALTNTVTGKRYIGLTGQTLRARFLAHLSSAHKGQGCRLVKEAVLQYGRDAFIAEALLVTDDADEAAKAEERFIAEFHTCDERFGYNRAIDGKGSKGAKHSAESRAQRSLYMVGNKRSVGIVPSQERRDKVRRALLGRTISAETRAKISATLKAKAAA